MLGVIQQKEIKYNRILILWRRIFIYQMHAGLSMYAQSKPSGKYSNLAKIAINNSELDISI